MTTLYKYNLIIENKYNINLNDKLGEGSFGVIYKGINKYTNKNVAIKIEDKSKSLLNNEAKIYNILNNINGVPKLRSYGSVNCFNYMVIDYIGESLENYRLKNNCKLSLNNVKSIGIQIIDIIEKIHNQGIIHRDIKPENFLIFKDKIYIIDFGLSKLYKYNNNHIIEKKINHIIGNVIYSSLNIHLGITPSRRDDIESIIYILIYLIYNKLPWKFKNKKINIEKILFIKKNINNYINLNNNIIIILEYIKKLKFYDKPNYNYIKNIINQL